MTIIERLTSDSGFTARQIKSVLEQFEESYVLEKMALIEASNSYREGKIQNLAKYLERALVDDFQAPKSSKESLEKLIVEKQRVLKKKKLDEKNRYQFRAYQTSQLPMVFCNLDKKQKDAISKAFESFISGTVFESSYAKDGLDNPLVADRFYDFIRVKHKDVLESLMSFEDFCKDDCFVE